MEQRINMDDLYAGVRKAVREAELASQQAELALAFARGRLAQLAIIQRMIENAGEDEHVEDRTAPDDRSAGAIER